MPGTVLIISPHFPPSTVAGPHRTRHLVKGTPTAPVQLDLVNDCVSGATGCSDQGKIRENDREQQQ
jgi:hypothetical protein